MQYILKVKDKSILQVVIVLKYIMDFIRFIRDTVVQLNISLYDRAYSKKRKGSLKIWFSGISTYQFLTLYSISKMQNRKCHHLSITVSSLLMQKLTSSAFCLLQPLPQKCSFFKLLAAADPIKQYSSCQRKLNRHQYQTIML